MVRSASPPGLLLWAAVWALIAVASPARADGRAPAARAVPVSPWIDREPLDPRAAGVQVAADRGVEWLLSDLQLRAGATAERYVRRAFRVEATNGIETVSELHFDYDPSFERLAVHFVHVLRGGGVIDALQRGDWKVIQPEADLDRRIYSGELEGLLFLHDVRVGDVIDYAYTVRGDNPVLAGHFVQQVFLDEDAGVADLRRRIVTDVARPLRLKAHGEGAAPVEAVDGEVRQYVWRRTNVPAPQGEDEVPDWYRSDGWVDVSDFAGWNEVAASAAALFEAKAATSSELTEQVAKWRRELPGDEHRALAATRFVQDEIRYLGIEIGPHSHQPFPAATVLQRRFGDCKDKSLLLVTLLRSLGIAADPVLVSTTTRRMLDDRLPSPFAFDHAIVRATIEGQPVFIDATASLQRGPLVGREPPPYERALVVSRDTQGLLTIADPHPKAPTYETDETYTLPRAGGDAPQLEVVTTFRGDDADDMRAKLASTSAAELGRRYLNYYAVAYPQVRALGDPVFEDDAAADVIVVRERYELPDFWQDGARELSPAAVATYLKAPKISRRRMPLGLAFPARVAAHIHVKMGQGQPDLPEPTDLRDEGARFHASSRFEGGVLVLDYEYESLADAVPVATVPAHLALLERIGKDWSYVLEEPSPEAAKSPPAEPVPARVWWTLGGVLGVAAVTWLTRRARAWRRRRDFQKRATIERGEAPTRPIVVGREGEIDAQIGKIRCSCRGRLARTQSAEAMAELRLGERTIRAVQVACPGCGEARRLYFEMKPT